MTSPAETIIRTRFAPSPSGHLHVGGARTALFCWAFARKHGGTFILRIEDTDQKRTSGAATVGFLHDLAWLGIGWDEGPESEGFGGGETGPYFCSQRLDIYHKAVDELLAKGRAYRAFETPEELEAARHAAKGRGEEYRYDRSGALSLDQATIETYINEGKPHVVRFRLPDDQSEISFHDEVLGDITTPLAQLDDFVIIKADGYPTYHFAVVVDDELMGITHIIRGQEHTNNTARHLMLQDALGYRRPVYAHVSVIFNPDGSKMSKRDKDKALRQAVKERGLKGSPHRANGEPVVSHEHWTWWQAGKDNQLELNAAEALAQELGVHLPEINVDDFKRAGYLPDVLINYLALLGWSPGGDVEKFDRKFFIAQFDMDRLIKSPAKFDREKLLAFNLDALQALSPDDFATHVREWTREYRPEFYRPFIDRYGDGAFDEFAKINQARSKTLRDPADSCAFFVIDDEVIEYDESKPVRKAMAKGDITGYDHLERMQPRLVSMTMWTAAALESEIRAYADAEADGKLGDVAQPLRIAITGGVVSPAIFETLAILGRNATLARIHHCIAKRSAEATLQRSPDS